MNKDLEENYEEEESDLEKDIHISRGHRDVQTDDEIEYEFDFEEYQDEEEDENGEYENEDEFENNKKFETGKFRRVHFSQTNKIIQIDRLPEETKG